MFAFQMQLKLVSNVSSPLRSSGLSESLYTPESLLFTVAIVNLLISIGSLAILGAVVYSGAAVLDEAARQFLRT